jgi:hypothetical protein
MAVHPTKVANTAGSLQRSLDYAKFGQLYKTKVLGMGNKFYQRMDRQKFITPNNNIRGQYYGYLFWNKTYKVNDVDYEVYYSSGNGGNRVLFSKTNLL